MQRGRILEVKPVIATSDDLFDSQWVLYKGHSIWVSVPQAAKECGLSTLTIYEWIRSEPEFPYRNVGVKSKYQVDKIALRVWIQERTDKEKKRKFKIPSGLDLLSRSKR